jgi:hypothetical protein
MEDPASALLSQKSWFKRTAAVLARNLTPDESASGLNSPSRHDKTRRAGDTLKIFTQALPYR